MITKGGKHAAQDAQTIPGPPMAALRAHEMKGMANVKVMPKVVPAPDDRHGFGHMDRVRA